MGDDWAGLPDPIPGCLDPDAQDDADDADDVDAE